MASDTAPPGVDDVLADLPADPEGASRDRAYEDGGDVLIA
jgi:hypothetical protein